MRVKWKKKLCGRIISDNCGGHIVSNFGNMPGAAALFVLQLQFHQLWKHPRSSSTLCVAQNSEIYFWWGRADWEVTSSNKRGGRWNKSVCLLNTSRRIFREFLIIFWGVGWLVWDTVSQTLWQVWPSVITHIVLTSHHNDAHTHAHKQTETHPCSDVMKGCNVKLSGECCLDILMCSLWPPQLSHVGFRGRCFCVSETEESQSQKYRFMSKMHQIQRTGLYRHCNITVHLPNRGKS